MKWSGLRICTPEIGRIRGRRRALWGPLALCVAHAIIMAVAHAQGRPLFMLEEARPLCSTHYVTWRQEQHTNRGCNSVETPPHKKLTTTVTCTMGHNSTHRQQERGHIRGLLVPGSTGGFAFQRSCPPPPPARVQRTMKKQTGVFIGHAVLYLIISVPKPSTS